MPRNIPGVKHQGYGPPKKKSPPVRSEISTGLTQPSKGKPTVRPPEIQSGLPKDVKGPPIPALQQFGYFGSIHDVNDRVQEISDAYQQKFGHLPSPGLVFDVFRSNTDDFHGLFGVLPASAAQAQAHQALGVLPGSPRPKPPKPGAQLAADLRAARQNGTLQEFEKEHHEELKALLKDPQAAGALVKSLTGNNKDELLQRQRELEFQMEQARQSGDKAEAERLRQERVDNLRQINQAGFGAEQIGGTIGGVLETLAKGSGQVATSLRHAPGGLYQLGTALALDERDMLAGRSPTRTQKIARQTAKGIKEDVEHPLRNPGFLFMDLLGFAGGGAGAVTRVARAGKIAREGGGVGAAAKALAHRPTGGTYELRVGDHVEHELQSENRAVALAQRQFAKRRNAKMALRHDRAGNPYPAGTSSVFVPEAAQEMLDRMAFPFRKYLSSEAKVGRLGAVRQRIAQDSAMDLGRRLDSVAGWSVAGSRTFSRLPNKAIHGLTRGEQMAIIVHSIDDLTPLETMRGFHQYAIEAGIGKASAHRRQLADLSLAEKAIRNPSKRFQKALDLTKQVVAEMEHIKIEQLGLSPVVAESRVARAGSVFRGGELPAVPAGHVRVYRGEGKIGPVDANVIGDEAAINKGNWFTDKPAIAESYAKKNNGKVFYVDVPEDTARAWSRKRLSDNEEAWTEYRFPPEHGMGAKKRALDDAGRVSPESFYLPFVSKAHTKGRPSDRLGSFNVRVGPGGVPPPQEMAELRHYFTGQSIMAGDARIDATHLATEAYARTVKTAAVSAIYKDLWENASVPHRPSGPERRFYVPIRDVRNIPPRLKEVLSKVDEGEFTAKDAAGLSKEHHKALLEALSPDEANLTAEEIKNVRWVDERLLSDTRRVPPTPSALMRGFQTVNEIPRDVTLYLRAAYILNAVGNTPMALLHQGVLLPANIARATMKERLYGERVAKAISAHVGEGRAKSYVAKDVEPYLFRVGGQPISQHLARFWSTVADKFFRESALIHEMRRRGIHTQAEAEDFFFNPARQKEFVESVRRANKAMVEFDNLTWLEKNAFRHFIFVYPWVSRSAVWSVRTLVEHPIVSDAFVQLGRQEHEQMDNDPLFKNAPEWFKNTGYFPVSWTKDGKPRVVNPTSVNSYSTLGELMDVAHAGVHGDQYSSFADLLGPGANLITHAALGRDEYGNEYPGSQWWGAAKEVLMQLPQVSAYGRKSKSQQKGDQPKEDLTNLRQGVENRNKRLQQTVFSPGYWSGYGSLISGGLTPRTFDPESAASRFWERQDLKTRHSNELKLVKEALKMQADLLGKKVPGDVAAAVSLAQQRTWQYAQKTKQMGRTLTKVEETQIDIQMLEKARRLSPDDAKTLTKRLAGMKTKEEVLDFRRAMLKEHGGTKAFGEWNDDVHFVYSFRPKILQAKLDVLARDGLIPKHVVKADQKTLYEYGRQALAFKKEAQKRKKAIDDPSLTEAEASLKSQDLRNWTDAQDKPIRVNGHTFPSGPRYTYANQTSEQRMNQITGAATSAWKSLSALDKELLGKKPGKNIGVGWRTLAYWKAAISGNLEIKGYTPPPVGERSVGKDWELKMAKAIEKQGDDGKPVPGFFKDYLFSQQPLFRRLNAFKPIQKSPNHAQWNDVFVVAAAMDKYRGHSSEASIRDTWKDYVQTTIMPYVEAHPKFKRELSEYGSSPQDFLNGIIN